MGLKYLLECDQCGKKEELLSKENCGWIENAGKSDLEKTSEFTFTRFKKPRKYGNEKLEIITICLAKKDDGYHDGQENQTLNNLWCGIECWLDHLREKMFGIRKQDNDTRR
jgi:hypothetical protein